MGRSRFKIQEPYYPYFITSSVVDEIALFADPKINRIILDALDYLRNRPQTKLYGYIIMHNHIHLIAESPELTASIRKFKSYTARAIIDELKKSNRSYLLKKLNSLKHEHHQDSEYQIWQKGVHPKQISSAKMMNQKLEYIHTNPIHAGFVDRLEHWRNSSARNYLGLDGVIGIDVFEG